MTKVVDLKAYRTKLLERRGFGPWEKRFGKAFDLTTRIVDLSDRILFYLAQPGEPSSVAYYEFIMGILDLGAALKFHYLDNGEQMRVVDIHLFLVDQVRFEMMRRLQWIGSFEGEKFSLVEMVLEFDKVKKKCRENPPQLATSKSEYSNYMRMTAGDKEVFIRQMLREALEVFEKRL